MLPSPVSELTHQPGQDPFEFQPLTRVDQADRELALELRALFEKLVECQREIASVAQDVAVLKQQAGLL